MRRRGEIGGKKIVTRIYYMRKNNTFTRRKHTNKHTQEYNSIINDLWGTEIVIPMILQAIEPYRMVMNCSSPVK